MRGLVETEHGSFLTSFVEIGQVEKLHWAFGSDELNYDINESCNTEAIAALDVKFAIYYNEIGL